jgi:hypothetical protein
MEGEITGEADVYSAQDARRKTSGLVPNSVLSTRRTLVVEKSETEAY